MHLHTKRYDSEFYLFLFTILLCTDKYANWIILCTHISAVSVNVIIFQQDIHKHAFNFMFYCITHGLKTSSTID